LDVDIGGLGIELGSMPNQPSIGIRLQYQSHCLDVDKIGRWNQSSWGIPIHVWMSTPWLLILSRRGRQGRSRTARRRRSGAGLAAEGGRGGAPRSSPAKGRRGAGGVLPGPHRDPRPWPKHAAARRSPPASSQPAPLLPQLRRRQRPSAPSLSNPAPHPPPWRGRGELAAGLTAAPPAPALPAQGQSGGRDTRPGGGSLELAAEAR